MSSTTTAAENLATLVLPAGETLEEYLYLIGQGIVVSIVVCSCFAIIVWDYFVMLPEEFSLYKMMYKDRRVRTNVTTYLFLLLRYSGMLCLMPAIFFSSVQSEHCQTAVTISQIGAIMATATSGALFIYRIIAMWSGNKIVYAVVCFVYLLMLGCWIAVATQYKATTGTATPFLTNCENANLPDFNAISWGSSVLFDALILALTLGKLRPSLKTTSSPVARQIFRDAFFYFIISTVVNILVLSLESSSISAPALKPATIAFGTVFTVAVGQRIYLNLRLLEKRRRKELEGLPLSSVSNSSTAGNRGTQHTPSNKYQPPYISEETRSSPYGESTYTPQYAHASESVEKINYDYPPSKTVSSGRSLRSPTPGEVAVRVDIRSD